MKNPIGVFDSGYGGLTVLKEIVKVLPEYDYLYLGDNAYAPYGPLPFETVYAYTLRCVRWFFDNGCNLVILACNTASAKALRSIQQIDLPRIDISRRVLGVIRPTSEVINKYTSSNHIGILATAGTVLSESYLLEIRKFHPQITVQQQAAPEWVELIESGNFKKKESEKVIEKYIQQILAKDEKIDCLLLACTHYPLLLDQITKHVPLGVSVISQGEIVANSLKTYLKDHPEMDAKISKNRFRYFFTTGNVDEFDRHATDFFEDHVASAQVVISTS